MLVSKSQARLLKSSGVSLLSTPPPPHIAASLSRRARNRLQHRRRHDNTKSRYLVTTLSQAEPSENSGNSGGEETLRVRIPQAAKTNKLGPNFWLTPEDAIELQLKCLQNNNFPSADHGIEILYRFAAFDPFARSNYFGRPLDLGQFERFRRILYTRAYESLLNHTEHKVLSSLEVAEDSWVARVLVINNYRKEEQVFEFKLQRRFGGRWDGLWYVNQLLADGMEDVPLYGLHSDA